MKQLSAAAAAAAPGEGGAAGSAPVVLGGSCGHPAGPGGRHCTGHRCCCHDSTAGYQTGLVASCVMRAGGVLHCVCVTGTYGGGAGCPVGCGSCPWLACALPCARPPAVAHPRPPAVVLVGWHGWAGRGARPPAPCTPLGRAIVLLWCGLGHALRRCSWATSSLLAPWCRSSCKPSMALCQQAPAMQGAAVLASAPAAVTCTLALCSRAPVVCCVYMVLSPAGVAGKQFGAAPAATACPTIPPHVGGGHAQLLAVDSGLPGRQLQHAAVARGGVHAWWGV